MNRRGYQDKVVAYLLGNDFGMYESLEGVSLMSEPLTNLRHYAPMPEEDRPDENAPVYPAD
jgi:hypothetical protein